MALLRQNKLTSQKDIKAVFRKGSTVRTGLFLIKYAKNNLTCSRFVFIISTKTLSKATARNRLKRVLSAAVNRQMVFMNRGYAVAVTIKKSGEEDVLIKEFLVVLREIKILK